MIYDMYGIVTCFIVVFEAVCLFVSFLDHTINYKGETNRDLVIYTHIQYSLAF